METPNNLLWQQLQQLLQPQLHLHSIIQNCQAPYHPQAFRPISNKKKFLFSNGVLEDIVFIGKFAHLIFFWLFWQLQLFEGGIGDSGAVWGVGVWGVGVGVAAFTLGSSHWVVLVILLA